ncbi:MAG: hypothetical protein ACI4UJ_01725 [Candidatus Cryptobacteroides sp.]
MMSDKLMKLLAALMLTVSLPGCRQGDRLPVNVVVSERACAESAAAQKQLLLSDRQTVNLKECLEALYSSGWASDNAEYDPLAESEKKSNAYKQFTKQLEMRFGKEKSREILAWYYNYINLKNE